MGYAMVMDVWFVGALDRESAWRVGERFGGQYAPRDIAARYVAEPFVGKLYDALKRYVSGYREHCPIGCVICVEKVLTRSSVRDAMWSGVSPIVGHR